MAEKITCPVTLIRYTPAMKAEWDTFVDTSRNGTFLIRRDYLEYHADRFPDHSFCFYHKNRLIALLPAHRRGNTLYSHAGLTYGGLILSTIATTARVLEILDLLSRELRAEGIEWLEYRRVPHHLHRYPCDEDRYALFRRNAITTACNIATVVDLSAPLSFTELRRRGVRKAQTAGVLMAESDAWGEFWQVLKENLQQRFGAEPVHTLEEIERLHALFPDKIRLFTATLDGRIEGGTVIYECNDCARVQYISSTPRGKESAVLDALFSYLLRERYAHFRYFDFGTSNGDNGYFLNEGLIAQKEGFGGRGIVYETYMLSLNPEHDAAE